MKYFSVPIVSLLVSLFISVSEIKTEKVAPILTGEPDDSIKITGVIKSFINWYKIHYREIHEEPLTYQDKSGNYQVNRDATERYLNKLKSSGFISESYISDWRQYFESRTLSFAENPQSEGPPEGFDFDLVVLTQEPELLWNSIDSVEFIFLIKDRGSAVVEVNGEWPHVFELSKKDDRWLIDYIFIADPE